MAQQNVAVLRRVLTRADDLLTTHEQRSRERALGGLFASCRGGPAAILARYQELRLRRSQIPDQLDALQEALDELLQREGPSVEAYYRCVAQRLYEYSTREAKPSRGGALDIVINTARQMAVPGAGEVARYRSTRGQRESEAARKNGLS